MARSDQVVRFAVGSPESSRSAVYRVWSPRPASAVTDVYVGLRRMGNEFKVSFHGERPGLTPRAHQSISVELRNQVGLDSRFLNIWSRQPLAEDLDPEFEILLPTSELSYEPEGEDSFEEVTWVCPAPEDGFIHVCLVFTPSRRAGDWPGNSFRNATLLGSLELNDGAVCSIVALSHATLPTEFREKLTSYKKKLPSAEPVFVLDPPKLEDTGTRVVIGFARDGRPAGWIEASFVSDSPAV